MDQKILAEAAVLGLPQLPCNHYLLTDQLYKSLLSFWVGKSFSEMVSCRTLFLLFYSALTFKTIEHAMEKQY